MMSTAFNSVVRRVRRYQRTMRHTRMVARAINTPINPAASPNAARRTFAVSFIMPEDTRMTVQNEG